MPEDESKEAAQRSYSQVKKSLGGFKANITRSLNHASTVLKRKDDLSKMQGIGELQDSVEHVKKSYNAYEEKVLEFIRNIATEGDADVYDKELTDFLNRRDNCIADLLQNIRLLEESMESVQQTGSLQSVGPVFKANETLKPFVLLLTHTPVQLREWLDAFKNYYSTSNMSVLTISEQQAYLLNVLDSGIAARVRSLWHSRTTIFGENGCLSTIEEEFRQQYPLFNRRLDTFRCVQKQGQSTDDYLLEHQQLITEGEFSTVDEDELTVLFLLMGIRDPKVKDLWMREHCPSKARLLELAKAEAAAASRKKAQEQNSQVYSAQAAAISNSQLGKSGKKSKKKSKNLDTQRKVCSNCGRSGHTADEKSKCFARDSVCHACQKKGHFKRMCRTNKAATVQMSG